MIQLTNQLWIGESSSQAHARLCGMAGVLNVARDLPSNSTLCWPTVEHAQVGLLDGPGNPVSTYCAAAIVLHNLLKRGKTLVYCHAGGRSLAVALVYLEMMHPRGWDGWFELMRERADVELPAVHEAHKRAFEAIDWAHLRELVK